MQKILMWKLGQLMISTMIAFCWIIFILLFIRLFRLEGRTEKTLSIDVKNELKKWSRRESNLRIMAYISSAMRWKNARRKSILYCQLDKIRINWKPAFDTFMVVEAFKPRGIENKTFRTASNEERRLKLSHKFGARSLDDWIHLSTNRN